MLLAIDTSTHLSSIALYDERGVVGETTWQSHENHTRSLMPEIVRLMQVVGTNANELRAIGVATGPGSFTGLRIGLSAAKGLAYSLNCALFGIPTLDITASAYANSLLPICAVLQVGRGRFGAAFYETRDDIATRVSDYFFGAPEGLSLALTQHAPDSFLATGEIDNTLRDALRATFQNKISFAPEASQLRRAGFLAWLAWRRWQAGAQDDLQPLAPIYVPTAALA